MRNQLAFVLTVVVGTGSILVSPPASATHTETCEGIDACKDFKIACRANNGILGGYTDAAGYDWYMCVFPV